MGSLASELRPIVAGLAATPRIYADANLPAGVVSYMRQALGWDVLFVLEHPDLRRAPDREHFHRAREYGRTLITMDRDFLDDHRYPAAGGPGVVVCFAPDETGLRRILAHLDSTALRGSDSPGAPLTGRKINATVAVFGDV